MRLPRPRLSNCCVHVTHRCHKREFLLGYDLVKTGSHLSRCLFYLDMNMVRAKAVRHPVEWIYGGARELLGRRQRYRAIDQECLLRLLAVPDISKFRQWHAMARKR